MALTTAQRDRAWREIIDLIAAAGPVTLTKPQLAAAAGGLDDYLDANAVQINNAIPQPARGALTTAQKARLLAAVTLIRFGG